MTGGVDPSQFIQQLEQEPTQQARNRILAHRDLFELLGETRANGGRPVVISDAPDELVSHTRGYGTGSRPEDCLDAFADYVKTHLNEVAALNIICTRPKELTRASLKDLRLTLDRESYYHPAAQHCHFGTNQRGDGSRHHQSDSPVCHWFHPHQP